MSFSPCFLRANGYCNLWKPVTVDPMSTLKMIGIAAAAYLVAWASDALFGWTGLIALTATVLVLPIVVGAGLSVRGDDS